MNNTYRESRAPYLFYIGSLVLFGTNGVVASYITSLETQQIILFRTLLGSLLLVPVYLMVYKGMRKHHERKQVLLTVLSGMSLGVMWMFQYEAYAEIGIGQSSLIYCVGPVMVLALAPLIFKDKMTASRVVGLALVLLGAVSLSVYGLGDGGSAWGYFCAAMTAVAYASLVIFNKSATGIVGLESSTMQMVSAFSIVLLYLFVTMDFPTHIASTDLVPILVLGLLNTGFGCLLYFSSTKRIPAPTVAICDYIEPVSALVLAAILLSEPFGTVELVGTVLILTGAVIGVRGTGRMNRSGTTN